MLGSLNVRLVLISRYLNPTFPKRLFLCSFLKCRAEIHFPPIPFQLLFSLRTVIEVILTENNWHEPRIGMKTVICDMSGALFIEKIVLWWYIIIYRRAITLVMIRNNVFHWIDTLLLEYAICVSSWTNLHSTLNFAWLQANRLLTPANFANSQ